ncbi:MAG TPA: hypothetical protein VM888_07505 [Chitinophagaceae bacterium]|nr:hypothetical protein [Chitinophagaceae bacterium]
MAQKENKGGELTNEQIEQDLKAKGAEDKQGGYKGSQDTGDSIVSTLGTDVQKKDGLPDEELDSK